MEVSSLQDKSDNMATPVPSEDCKSALSSLGSPMAKRRKTATQFDLCPLPQRRRLVCDAKRKELLKLKSSYREHLTELFFLQNGGQLMDYYTWRRRPTIQLLNFLKSGRLDSDNEDEALIPEKHPEEMKHDGGLTPTDTRPSTPLSANSSDAKFSFKLEASSIGDGSCLTPGADSTMVNSSRSGTSTPVPTSTPVHSGVGTPAYSSLEAKSLFGPLSTPGANKLSTSYNETLGSQEAIVERAKQEAQVMQRVAELRKMGMWSTRRLPKVQEPPRQKAHWDYLLEEMQWLAADFAQERRWKKAGARKIARMISKYFTDRHQKEKKAEREEGSKIKRIASNIAKMVREFWSNIEKVVEYKQSSRLEEKRQKAMDLHLNFIVDQTEKYSNWLTEGLGVKNAPGSAGSTASSSVNMDDVEFEPDENETDDEETIEKEEGENPVDQVNVENEVNALRVESEMPIEELLKSLPPEMLDPSSSLPPLDLPEPPSESKTNSGLKRPCNDSDFEASESESDVEETLEEQENVERVDHQAEIDELKAECDMTMDELYAKYSGAYTEEFDKKMAELSDGEGSTDFSDESDDNESSEDEENKENSESSEEKSDESVFDEAETKDDLGTSMLLNSADDTTDKSKLDKDKELRSIAETALSLQPTGYTLETTQVRTDVPFLLKHTLREYQHVGLDWLATMHDRKLNGILADEMGLGKTIQTIAVLAHLACVHGVWGPHLIVVPTSVMLNWEMELKKWCPSFKILTYYGSQKERKLKRQGWTKTNAFHVCVTSYKLVIQDHQSFRRKKWKYFILDEAQNIKNFKSQRWQTLLNFQSQRRLLLTGTPLQNSLMELWSLMHFLMPHVFASHRDFKEWFSNPLSSMVEGSREYNENLIRRLHKVLRPFLLRRLKNDVEKQMPQKYEHVVMCSLSKRQRYLYDDFMSQTKTKETLASGHYMSVINILMQLRKVCNHPNLFDQRPIVSPFQMAPIIYTTASLVQRVKLKNPLMELECCDFCPNLSNLESVYSKSLARRIFGLKASHHFLSCIDKKPELDMKPVSTRKFVYQDPALQTTQTTGPTMLQARVAPRNILVEPSGLIQSTRPPYQASAAPVASNLTNGPVCVSRVSLLNGSGGPGSPQVHSPLQRDSSSPVIVISEDKSPFYSESLAKKRSRQRLDRIARIARFNNQHCDVSPVYGTDVHSRVSITELEQKHLEEFKLVTRNSSPRASWHLGYVNCHRAQHCQKLDRKSYWSLSDNLQAIVRNPQQHLEELTEILDRFVFVIPAATAPPIQLRTAHPPPSLVQSERLLRHSLQSQLNPKLDSLHKIVSSSSVQFPDVRLIQYDCGKLQTLDLLLRQLKKGDHRILLFTQMTRMLDVLELFLNYHGHRYLRLDGSTKIEQRQLLMDRFNADARIFCFILSTRSGGIGVNLTGADTVIFYDSDWNPTMDAQAQDRCHRIGQTRDVHIYRLISKKTVEENILKKANQKRLLGDVAIEGGNFTTAFFKQQTIDDLFAEPSGLDSLAQEKNQELARKNNLDSQPTATEAKDVKSAKPCGVEIESSVAVSNERPKRGSRSSTVSRTSSPAADVDKLMTQDQMEQALCHAEDETDVIAAKVVKAEQKAELAEFDENIPWDEREAEKQRENAEVSKVEMELAMIDKELTPVERYAVSFIELQTKPLSQEELKEAEEEVAIAKEEWELSRLQALREEEERRAELEDDEMLFTFSREDAYNQVKQQKCKKGHKRVNSTGVVIATSKRPPSMGIIDALYRSPQKTPRKTPSAPVTPKSLPSKTVCKSLSTKSPPKSPPTKSPPAIKQHSKKIKKTLKKVSPKKSVSPLKEKQLSKKKVLKTAPFVKLNDFVVNAKSIKAIKRRLSEPVKTLVLNTQNLILPPEEKKAELVKQPAASKKAALPDYLIPKVKFYKKPDPQKFNVPANSGSTPHPWSNPNLVIRTRQASGLSDNDGSDVEVTPVTKKPASTSISKIAEVPILNKFFANSPTKFASQVSPSRKSASAKSSEASQQTQLSPKTIKFIMPKFSVAQAMQNSNAVTQGVQRLSSPAIRPLIRPSLTLRLANPQQVRSLQNVQPINVSVSSVRSIDGNLSALPQDVSHPSIVAGAPTIRQISPSHLRSVNANVVGTSTVPKPQSVNNLRTVNIANLTRVLSPPKINVAGQTVQVAQRLPNRTGVLTLRPQINGAQSFQSLRLVTSSPGAAPSQVSVATINVNTVPILEKMAQQLQTSPPSIIGAVSSPTATTYNVIPRSVLVTPSSAIPSVSPSAVCSDSPVSFQTQPIVISRNSVGAVQRHRFIIQRPAGVVGNTVRQALLQQVARTPSDVSSPPKIISKPVAPQIPPNTIILSNNNSGNLKPKINHDPNQ